MGKLTNKQKIRYRIRRKIKGSVNTPRLSVFRSNKFIYCQLIDDINGITVASADSTALKGKTNTESAVEVGKIIAEKARSKNISTVVFDRGGNLYHGRIKALADSAREAGLNF